MDAESLYDQVMGAREPTEVEAFLLALAREPERLPEAPPAWSGTEGYDGRLIDGRTRAGGRLCYRCTPHDLAKSPTPARVAVIAGPSKFKPEAGRRWLDLCMPCVMWLRSGLDAIPDNRFGLAPTWAVDPLRDKGLESNP